MRQEIKTRQTTIVSEAAKDQRQVQGRITPGRTPAARHMEIWRPRARCIRKLGFASAVTLSLLFLTASTYAARVVFVVDVSAPAWALNWDRQRRVVCQLYESLQPGDELIVVGAAKKGALTPLIEKREIDPSPQRHFSHLWDRSLDPLAGKAADLAAGLSAAEGWLSDDRSSAVILFMNGDIGGKEAEHLWSIGRNWRDRGRTLKVLGTREANQLIPAAGAAGILSFDLVDEFDSKNFVAKLTSPESTPAVPGTNATVSPTKPNLRTPRKVVEPPEVPLESPSAPHPEAPSESGPQLPLVVTPDFQPAKPSMKQAEEPSPPPVHDPEPLQVPPARTTDLFGNSNGEPLPTSTEPRKPGPHGTEPTLAPPASPLLTQEPVLHDNKDRPAASERKEAPTAPAPPSLAHAPNQRNSPAVQPTPPVPPTPPDDGVPKPAPSIGVIKPRMTLPWLLPSLAMVALGVAAYKTRRRWRGRWNQLGEWRRRMRNVALVRTSQPSDNRQILVKVNGAVNANLGPLASLQRALIGSSQRSTVRCSLPGVRPQHAILSSKLGQPFLRNLGWRPVVINGRRVLAWRPTPLFLPAEVALTPSAKLRIEAAQDS